MADSALFYEDTLPAGSHWSLVMKRGTCLRLIDRDGGVNAGVLFYNPANLLERYNAPDTLKCQHTFKLTAGHCLYSDMGRVFCAITADTMGWHDTVCGTSNKAQVSAQYGDKGYQQYRNERHQNGYDSLLIEAAKYGMGQKDLAACVNFFSKVVPDDEGRLSYQSGASKAGDYVDLRFEMDTLVLLHSCPHPLNKASEYPRQPLVYQLRTAAPVADDDLCKNSRPENQRGFHNNALYHFGS